MRHLTMVALCWMLFAGAAARSSPASGAEEIRTSDSHTEHSRAMENRQLQRSVIPYKVPELQLLRDDGRTVSLERELADGRAVVLNFIYTTCTTTCPLSSQVFSVLQDKLGAARSKVHLVSISIDPEQDTPARLRLYAEQFHARAGWQHYTGTRYASIAVQQAFGAYRGDKMSHLPLTLLRAAGGGPWVRLDGFASADELLAEIRGFDTLAASR